MSTKNHSGDKRGGFVPVRLGLDTPGLQHGGVEGDDGLRGRPIPPPPSVPAYLPTHRRRGPAQLAADLSHRRPAGQAAGDGFPLRQRQCETGPLARRRGDPACPRHLIPHDLGDPAQRTTDGIQRFPVSPPAPQFRLLRRRQTWATSLHHETSSLGSCCIDPLNAPLRTHAPWATDDELSVGERMISSESRMREIRTSGSMSGDWKRSYGEE